jgi:DNA-directed RNA polymerase specialized sigma24 family protein
MTMGQRKTYTAVVTRDEAGWWVGIVRGLAGVHSQARRLDQLRGRLLEAVAAAGVRDADVKLDIRLPKPTLAKVRQAAAARRKAEQASGAAASSMREAARQLASSGLSVRDAAELLGVSFQRVHQLVSD